MGLKFRLGVVRRWRRRLPNLQEMMIVDRCDHSKTWKSCTARRVWLTPSKLLLTVAMLEPFTKTSASAIKNSTVWKIPLQQTLPASN